MHALDMLEKSGTRPKGIAMSGITFDHLIQTIEDALAVVAKKGKDTLDITLMKAELELVVTASEEVGGGAKFDWLVSVDLSGKIGSSNTHTLSLTLIPVNKAIKLGSEKDELADAILALAQAIKTADQSKFSVTEGKVHVKFVVSSEGNLKLVAGGGAKKENTHSIKLTFQPGM
jgi:hypothetical protein